MANKRMFSLSVVDTDNFLEMPISSRLLYYELGMRADDDGFVNNWKKIMLFTGLKEDDLKILIAKKYIIPFDSGVIVIRHWRMNNYLQNDRTKPTIYQKELEQLDTDKNNVYTLDTECIHSIDKNSIDKNRLDNNNGDTINKKFILTNNFKQNIQCEFITKSSKERCCRKSTYCINGKNYCNQHAKNFIPNMEIEIKFKKPTLEEVKEYCKERNNNVDPEQFLNFYESKDWMVGKNKMKDWKACIRTWEKRTFAKETPMWFNKEQELKTMSKQEEEEIENILKNIGE